MAQNDKHENEIIGVFPGNVTTLLLFVLLFTFSTLVGLLAISALSMASGLDGVDIISRLDAGILDSERSFLRTYIVINHLSMFIVPSLALAWFLRRKKWAAYLSIDKLPSASTALLSCFFLLAGMPLAQAAFWLNKQIPLPEWAVSMEDSTAMLMSNLLEVDSPIGLLLNIFIIAVIPAFGEEFVFRGILQKNLSRMLNRPHLAVWLAAIIFSAFHMQFEGFLARLALGALLGYLFYWTRNLWLPIIAHFFTNALQLILQYKMPEQFSQSSMEGDLQLPWPGLVVSSFLLGWIGYTIWKKSKENSESIGQAEME
ncbi:MAG: CPBP family intramembrane glutamic endopeptidase [Bacteroidota bacterium]